MGWFLRLTNLVIGLAVAGAAAVAAAAPVAPVGCQASIDVTNLPSSGGNVNIGLNCPNPAPNGIYATMQGPYASGLYSNSNAGATVGGIAYGVLVPANTTAAQQTLSWYWRVCDYTQVACVNTNLVTATVAPAQPVPVCSVSASNTSPQTGQTIALTASCSNSPTSYSWTGCTSSTSSCTDAASTAGSKTYTVVASNATGPGASASVTVTWTTGTGGASPPVCTLTASNGTPQTGETITLSASCSNSPTSYSWTGCSSTTSSCNDSSSTVGAKAYTVVASNGAGSGAPLTIIVSWINPGVPPPVCAPTQNPANPVTPGTQVTLTANCTNNPTAYNWTTNGTPIAGGATLLVTPQVSTTYAISAANASGASLPATISVVVSAPAGAPTNCSATINGSNSVRFGAGGGTALLAVTGCAGSGLTYNWSRNGIASVSNAQSWTDASGSNSLLGPNNTGNYNLSSYQVTICAGSACVTLPAAAPKGTAVPLTALVAPAAIASSALVSVVEFYNSGLDHYFVSWIPSEISQLVDGTTIKGWQLTGTTFTAYNAAQSGTSPVCRYYIPPGLGDSHFFGRGTAECSATGQKNPSFVLEDAAFMQMNLPAAGNCPAGTTPVYRVFSNRPDANHRYMTDKSIRSQMTALGWIAEGDGPDLVVMCAPSAPASSQPVPVCSISASNASPQTGQAITVSANCTGNPTSYTWTGCTSSTDNCTDSSATAVARTYTVVASNGAGSSAPVSVTVTWTNPSGSSLVCTLAASNTAPQTGQTITISANCSGNPTSYTWTGCTPGTSSCTDSSATAGPRTYTLVASNATGNSTSATITVTWTSPVVVSPPVCAPRQDPANPVAPNAQVTLTANCTNNPTSYSWTMNGAPIPGGATLVVSPQTSTLYTVAATNSAGTSPPVTISVTVTPPEPTSP